MPTLIRAHLILVRHGQSIWNLENLFTGWTDVDLSAQGVQEAQRAGLDIAEASCGVGTVWHRQRQEIMIGDSMAQVNWPIAMTLTVEPVVTFQAPPALLAPIVTVNGARLEIDETPPANTMIAEPPPSAMLTAPGLVDAGTMVRWLR